MLKNKVIVVTGGAGVLGSQFCSAIAECGGIAIVADANLSAARNVAEKVNTNFPDNCNAIFLDITSTESVIGLINKLHNEYGHIDAVINNAYPRNKNYGRKLENVTYEDFCENLEQHLGGYFLVSQKFGLYFKTHSCGNIVNISSIYGVMTPRFSLYEGTSMTMPIEYAAIKAGVIQLTRYFAQYFKGSGMRINCISPGGLLGDQPSEFIEAYNTHCSSKGMLSPSDVVGCLLFLLSDESKFINGQNIIVDDGFSL